MSVFNSLALVSLVLWFLCLFYFFSYLSSIVQVSWTTFSRIYTGIEQCDMSDCQSFVFILIFFFIAVEQKIVLSDEISLFQNRK